MDSVHVAVVGTGRVGRATLLLLVQEKWVGQLSLVDTKEGLASAIDQEVRHALASTRNDMSVNSFEKNGAFEGADIVLVCAGTPRDTNMESRNNLTEANAEIIKHIASVTPSSNPEAKFIIVTNPVDAMATLFKKISGKNWVISTGTNLETQRFRAALARKLNEPIRSISGFVAGEHGSNAVFLWSSVKINGVKLNRYLSSHNKSLDKKSIEKYVKTVSKRIIDASGGTRHGPATSFRDIIRSVALDEKKLLPIATPYKSKEFGRQVMVSRPQIVGNGIGPEATENINEEESDSINKAARKVYEAYEMAKKSVT